MIGKRSGSKRGQGLGGIRRSGASRGKSSGISLARASSAGSPGTARVGSAGVQASSAAAAEAPQRSGGISVTLRAASSGLRDADVEDRHAALESAVRAIYAERQILPEGAAPDASGRVAVDTPAGPRPVPASLLSREGLFAAVEDLCRHGQGARLNAMMRGVAAERAASVSAELSAAGSGSRLLARLAGEWGAWSRQVSAVRQVALYLDRSLVTRGEASLARSVSAPSSSSAATGSALGPASSARSASAAALAGPASGVWADAAIEVRSALLAEPEGGKASTGLERVVEAVLAAAAADRGGSGADRAAARVAARCLFELGLYGDPDSTGADGAEPGLASRLVAAARGHWSSVASVRWAECGFPPLAEGGAGPGGADAAGVGAAGVVRYLESAGQDLAAEADRFASALDPTPTGATGRACVAAAERALLGVRWQELARDGVPSLLAAGRGGALRRLRRLVSRVAPAAAGRADSDGPSPGEAAVLDRFGAAARAAFDGAIRSGRANESAAPAKGRKAPSSSSSSGKTDTADGHRLVPLLLATRRVLQAAAVAMAAAPAAVPPSSSSASSSSASAASDTAVVPDRALERALREAAADAMSAEPSAVAEALAKHLDVLMRGGPKAAAATSAVAEAAATIPGHEAVSDAASPSPLPPAIVAAASAALAGPPATDAEASASECLALFRCLRAKDVFEAFYRKDLAKRLLLARSASADAERGVIAALKAECGPKFTAKLEGMMRDADACGAVEAAFRSDGPDPDGWAREDGAVSPRLEFGARTLTTTHWPSYAAWVPVLPPVLSRPLAAFEGWFKAAHAGRRLVWQHSLGSCTVLARFPAGRKHLVVSELQAAVLLLFNGRDEIPFGEIRAAVGAADAGAAQAGADPDARGRGGGPPPAEEVTRAVLSLCVSKHRILRRIRPGADAASSSSSSKAPSALSGRVTDGDAFRFHAGFKSRLLQVRVNQLQLRETKQERSDTAKRVSEARQLQTDAALVRIMKTRKSLRHEQLLAECVAQLRFPALPADIKRRVESLLTRDYLERDDDDRALYHYVA